MARLGIDFGTTNTVAVIHDRGLLSVVLHAAKTGAGTIVQETFPSAILIHTKTGQRWYGLEADRRFGQVGPGRDHVFVPSLKRQLHGYAEGRSDAGSGAPTLDVATLLRGFLEALRDSIRHARAIADDEPLEAVITWPANANGAQRHITRRCFREAGFEVIDTLNEPTASAIELADCVTAGRGKGAADGPSAVAVFDLGGGTFDASVVWIEDGQFRVLASAGVEDLGGDDFDHVLLEMFLERLGAAAGEIGALTRHALLRQARSQKEMISAGATKSLFLNPADFGLGGRPAMIAVEAYEERIEPMLAPAIRTLHGVLAAAADKEPRLAARLGSRQADGATLTLYLVGGSSKLPLVARMAAEAFPTSRVVLTDKPFSSVAMGAAVCATQRVQYRDVFARHFGLIRLRDHGRAEMFDSIFPAGTPIPRRGEPPLERVARYHPRHNVGHLRYLECTSVGEDGMPEAGVRPWSDILFPYDPSVPLTAPPPREEVIATDRFAGHPVCEVYRCDADGVITVELRRPACHDARAYEIYRD